jgi:hypothetical protein
MNERRLHKVMQTKIKHGHEEKKLDDYIPFQLVAYFLLQTCTKGDFLIESSPFDFE